VLYLHPLCQVQTNQEASMLSRSSRDLDWIDDPVRNGRVDSFPVSLSGPRIFKQGNHRAQLVCATSERHDIQPEILALVSHQTSQRSAQPKNVTISTKGYLKLVDSLLPPTAFGQKMKPDMPCDAKQIAMLSHLGARCDGETSSSSCKE
jgi:hypothetical protein